MAVLDWIEPNRGLLLRGQGVRLRPPRITDHPAWAELRQASKPFLQPWEPVWPADDLTRPAFRRRLSAYARDMDADAAYPFFVFDAENDALVGGVTLSNVRRGVAQAATIGYWVGRPHARRGYTLAAVRAVADYAFGRLGLHRLEAACIPENEPSRALLLKAGFRQEGFARAYLKINGAWRDHLLFGMLADDLTPPG
ncbi:MAG TPA: GNAT family protein [Caulobacteraceae bacterium]|jgi:ribosomal-protein-alanine N-acetyltransferase